MTARRSLPQGQAQVSSTRPIIESLDRQDCEALLERHHVGRLAYAFRNRVDIEPIHYVYSKGKIYGRTSEGTKVSTIAHSHWVAFEVDEVHGMFAWESVVVHGGFYILTDEGTDLDRTAWREARTALQRLHADFWTARDPVPDRTLIFQVHADELTGRRARP